MLTPFDYQVRAIDELRDAVVRKGMRRLILCMLMAAGKTHVAYKLMEFCQARGNKSLFITDRRMLTRQAHEGGKDHGLHTGIIMARRGHELDAPCQFASKQTMESWIKRDKITLPNFSLIIFDECHRGVSQNCWKLIDRWPGAVLVGLTATPCLGNGSGMGAYYQYLCQPIMPSGLREMGRIVPVRAFAPHIPDLNGVKKDADGDWQAKALSKVMTRDNLVGDIPGWWKKLGENRPSVYFACDVAHAMAIRQEFRDAGVTCELICEDTDDEEREEIEARSKSGATKVVVNVDVLAEGINWKWVSCIGLVRPTKRLRRYMQTTGRGLRADEGKRDLIIIDHSGCVLYHGFPDIDRDWPLSSSDNIDDIAEKAKKDGREPTVTQCSKCMALFSGTRKCPECGHIQVFQKPPKDYALKNGTLIEVQSDGLDTDTKKLLMQRYWGTCIGAAVKQGRTAGMAAHMFSKKFGVKPWEVSVSPMPPNRDDWKKLALDVFPGFARTKT